MNDFFTTQGDLENSKVDFVNSEAGEGQSEVGFSAKAHSEKFLGGVSPQAPREITTIDPEAPQTEKAYRRLIKDATDTRRFGKNYEGGGKAEFDALSRLYAVDPEHVAKPISIIEDPTKKAIGYNMEYVDGITVSDYIEKQGNIPANVASQIRDSVSRFHNNGLSHGDLNSGNVFINNNGIVKFFDPVGYENIPPEEFRKYKDLDLKDLEGWI